MIGVEDHGPFDKIALVGTAKAGAAALTGTPVDALVAGLGGVEPPRAALLGAGAFEAYRLAALSPARGAAPAAAAADARRPCGPAFAATIRDILQGEMAEALPEAVRGLRRAGLRLADELLPAALDCRDAAARQALFEVIGERGVWLAQFREEWRWARLGPDVADALPADAEQRFQESRPTERLELLQRARRVDPAAGRRWVEAVWSQEKPEMRASMAEALAIGVSIDDEPFLEACRQDRGAGVRKAAHEAALLIPGSAADARARVRAERCLNAKGEFEPPQAFEKEWGQDGLVQAAPGGRGARGWWLAQIVAATPPDFWVGRLKQSPRKLIEQAFDGDHKDDLCEGWALAALRHLAVDWIEPLFDYWREARPKRNAARVASDLTERLFNTLPTENATRVLERAFDGPATQAMDDVDVRLLIGWQGDWTVELGNRFVKWVQARLEAVGAARESNDVAALLSRSAFRLPLECLPAAPLGEFLPEPSTYPLRQLHAAVERFNATADFRRRLIAEAGSGATIKT